MSVTHQHPHPLAMKVVIPSNKNIADKFGQVRVEDWDDRVSGQTLVEKLGRGTFPEVDTLMHVLVGVKTDGGSQDAIVRCHSVVTGELVLLHDDWLPTVLELP